jgi:hypothetical protein
LLQALDFCFGEGGQGSSLVWHWNGRGVFS